MTVAARDGSEVQRAGIAEYVWITFGISVAVGIAASIIQAVVGTSLSVLGIIAFVLGVQLSGQRFFKKNGRVPTVSEARRYATWSTVLQILISAIGILAVVSTDPKVASDPVFWQIMGGVGLLLLVLCFLVARYRFVSAARSAAAKAQPAAT